MSEINYANTIKIKVIKESMVAGNSSSTTSMSPLKLFKSRPIGVMSKKRHTEPRIMTASSSL